MKILLSVHHGEFSVSPALLIINFIVPETCVRLFGFLKKFITRHQGLGHFSIYQPILSNHFIELEYIFLCQNCSTHTHLPNSCNERVESDQVQGRLQACLCCIKVKHAPVLQCSSAPVLQHRLISSHCTGGAGFTKSQCFH